MIIFALLNFQWESSVQIKLRKFREKLFLEAWRMMKAYRLFGCVRSCSGKLALSYTSLPSKSDCLFYNKNEKKNGLSELKITAKPIYIFFYIVARRLVARQRPRDRQLDEVRC
jgi:hypothetical protein